MKLKPYVCLVILLAIGCGSSETANVDNTQYVDLTVAATTDGEGGSISMTGVQLCTNDADTGLFQATFSGETNKALTVKIKGFSTSEKTYTCTQSDGNSSGDLGNKYDSCSVELSIPDSGGSYSTYAMHRNVDTLKSMAYSGACTIAITYENPKVTGTINCADMIQTHLEGSPRNPIDSSVTANISSSSSFFCNL